MKRRSFGPWAASLAMLGLFGCGLDAVGPDLDALAAARADTDDDGSGDDVAGDAKAGDAKAGDGSIAGNVCVQDSDCFATGCERWGCVDKRCTALGWRDEGESCVSADLCVISAVCEAQACTATGMQSCDDGDPCTVDGCDPAQGCVAVAIVAREGKPAPCDDGDFCTEGDQCTVEGCKGVPNACDDDNVCTSDACAEQKCVNVAVSVGGAKQACDDGDVCTVGDSCDGDVCLAGAATVCDDGNACTDDACAHPGGCAAVANAAGCDDASACTSEQCSGGACTVSATLDCDDGSGCTVDSCDAAKGCVHDAAAADGVACDDGLSCTLGDACAAGACAATDVFGPRALPAVYQGDLTDGVRVGAATYLVGARQPSALDPVGPWLLRAEGAADAVSAVALAALPAKTNLGAVDASALAGAAVLVAGAAPVGGDKDALVVANVAADGGVVAQASAEIAGQVGVRAVIARPDGAGVVVGVRAKGGALAPLIAAIAPGGKVVHAVATVLPKGELYDACAHPRGAMAVGRVDLEGDKPMSALIDDAGRVVSWHLLAGGGIGRATAVAALSDGGLLAAGRWTANDKAQSGDGAPTWWQLDARGRPLQRRSMPTTGDVFALAAAAAGGAAALVQGSEGPASLWVLDDTLDVVAAGPVFAPTAGAQAPTPRLLVAGHAGWLAIAGAAVGSGDAAVNQVQAVLLHRFAASSCAAAGACAEQDDASCDDGNACTRDGCDAAIGCTHDAHGGACADGEACLTGASCVGGGCAGGKPRLFGLSAEVDKGGGAGGGPLVAARRDGGATVVLRGTSTTKTGTADVVRFGADGKALWSHELKTEQVNSLAGIGDDIVLGGSTQEVDKVYAWLERRDAEGVKLWSVLPTKGQKPSAAVAAVTAASPKRIVAVGTVAGSGSAIYEGLTLMLDGKGGVDVVGSVAPPKGIVARQFFDVRATDHEGSAVAVGLDNGATDTQLVVCALYKMTQPLWSYHYGALKADSSGILLPRLVALDYGGFGVRVQRPDGKASLAVFERGGAKRFEAVLGSGDVDANDNLLQLADGGLATVGKQKSAVVLARVDAGGNPTGFTTTPIASAVELAVAATVLTSADVLVVTQALLDSGKRVVDVRRTTPEGYGDCASAGLCGATPATACQSGLPCQSALCDPTLGCGGAKQLAIQCVGDPCAGLGTCTAAGACVDGKPSADLCDDDNPCTLDACTQGVGCEHPPLPDKTPCDDGQPCTKDDVCTAGACTPGTPQGC